MIIDFTLANYGPFSNPVTLTFEATNDTHLEPSYVRAFGFPNGKVLRLLRAAVIYGPNAAGKTSILDALGLLDSLVMEGKRETSTPIDVNGFAFQQNAKKKPTELTIRFLRNKKIFRYHLKVTSDSIEFEKLELLKTPPSGTTYITLFKRKQGDARDKIVVDDCEPLQLNQAQHEKLQVEVQPNTTVLYTLNRKMTTDIQEVKEAFAFFEKQIMNEVTSKTKLSEWVTNQIEKTPALNDYIKQQFNSAGIPIHGLQIEKKPLDESERLFLKDASDRVRQDLEKFFEYRKTVVTEYQVKNDRYRLSLEQESFGTQRYLGVVGLLSALCGDNLENDIEGGRILPLDEMEHSLHPELIKHFWVSFLRDKSNSQIITTSHYRELLQDRTLFRDDSIWFVDKNPDTLSSSLYVLEDVKAEAGMRSTSSVYNYYTQGRLGATPQFPNDHE